jgi:hypothetical protein
MTLNVARILASFVAGKQRWRVVREKHASATG